MYLKEYINKLKTGNFIDEKKWLDQNAILETISEEIPDSGTEEWKNFRTNSIKETSWKVLLENSTKQDYLKQEKKLIFLNNTTPESILEKTFPLAMFVSKH